MRVNNVRKLELQVVFIFIKDCVVDDLDINCSPIRNRFAHRVCCAIGPDNSDNLFARLNEFANKLAPQVAISSCHHPSIRHLSQTLI